MIMNKKLNDPGRTGGYPDVLFFLINVKQQQLYSSKLVPRCMTYQIVISHAASESDRI